MPPAVYSLPPSDPDPAGAQKHPDLIPGTFWLPLTPPMRRALRVTNRAPLGYLLLYLLIGAAVMRLLLVPPGWLPVRWSGRGLRAGESIGIFLLMLFRDPRRAPLLAYVLLICVVAALVALRIWARQAGQARQDRGDGTFERHIGYVKVLPVWRGFEMEVGPERLRVPARGRGWMVRKLNWAAVDYAVHRGLVFEVRDQEDRIVYRAPAYRPESVMRVVSHPEG